jgi:hypothetical protein
MEGGTMTLNETIQIMVNDKRFFDTFSNVTPINKGYEYIAFRLLESAVATKQTRCIMDAIAKLDQLPFRFQIYKKGSWSSKGIRVLPVDNYSLHGHQL